MSIKPAPPTTLLSPDNFLVSDPAEIPEILANQFCSVFVTEDPGLAPDIILPRTQHGLLDVHFRPDDILVHLEAIKDHSSPGPDEIHPVLMKRCARALSPILAELFQRSMSQGTLPQEWRTAIVIPLYKKGDRTAASNYRPISLTSPVIKTMERIVADAIINFCLSHDVFPDNQHGFLPGRSSTTNLLKCLSDWTRQHDAGQPTDVIYLDFEKAFDRVPHQRLLRKLEHLGLRGNLLAWIAAFLDNRSFRVRVDGHLSSEKVVTSGVPQGSVLGPLLFVLYISDLCRLMKVQNEWFADDAKCYGDPILLDLQAELDILSEWSVDWLLTVNPLKCSVLHIGKKNPRRNYTLRGLPIPAVSHQLDLGIVITQELKWNVHVKHATKKANAIVYLVRKSFKFLTPQLFRIIFQSYILPILEYCHSVWSPYFAEDLQQLDSVLRKASKLVPTLRHLTYPERLTNLRLTTSRDRFQRGDLVETYKILNGIYDCPALDDYFLRSINLQLRGHEHKLAKDRFRLNPYKNILRNRVVDSWNQLSSVIVNSSTLPLFKSRLDRMRPIP